jgi:hypothetical protein
MADPCAIVVTDLLGRNMGFPSQWNQVVLTHRLGDFSSGEIHLHKFDAYSSQLRVAERAVQVFVDGVLRLHGQIWEPLVRSSSEIVVNVRDPFAGFAWRRNRVLKSYTNQDAQVIAIDRVNVQNAIAETFLMAPAFDLGSPIVRNGNLTDGSASVTGLSTTADLGVGHSVLGPGVPAGAKIVSIDSPTSLTLSHVVDTSIYKGAQVTTGSPTLTAVEGGTADIVDGMTIFAPLDGIPVGTTVLDVPSGSTVLMSNNGTSTEHGTPLFTLPNPVSLTFTPVPTVGRTVRYQPGKREDEILKELSSMYDGFYFKVNPVFGIPNKFGRLDLMWPDAGITRPEVRFEFGTGTLDNLTGYERQEMLPHNRHVSSSSSEAGGRITGVFQDAESQAKYGLLEDETTYSEVSEVPLLEAFARADVRPTPPTTYTITPSPDAPLLFRDFDVGDFVRLTIRDKEQGVVALETSEWARVTEASLTINANGVSWTSAISVETETGSKPYENPERRWREAINELRWRQEMLERKVQNLDVPEADPPADPGGDEGSGDDGEGGTPPGDPDPPDDPPPPPPADPPDISAVRADGYNQLGVGTYVIVSVDLDPKGQGFNIYITLTGRAEQNFSVFGTWSGTQTRDFRIDGVPIGGGTADVRVTTGAGEDTGSDGYNVPSVGIE